MVKEVNSENFEAEVLKSDLPVVVDFWAEWCGPCKQLAPIFAELSTSYEGKLIFAKCDVEKSQDISKQFSIRSIPCLIVFHGGQEIERMVGSMSKDSLKQKFDAAIKKAPK